ncbi:STAS domain-containing protein [Pseudonocardia endophytica]|uniref:Anti-sigma factor antagonist n=1 Tax=Pseudonocardia endophytica TaxID=401976 RepID=A0A4R1I204_PSEEN|nr:STAS domain-containing protein [Pseudonocardia endophytica]TCK27290.1 anti-anti-sigma factor [Pseudonocardia endophytica]
MARVELSGVGGMAGEQLTGASRFATTWPEPPSQVQLNVRSIRAGVEVLEVHGDIDLTEAGAITERTHELLCGPARMVVLDLSGVRFMGSHGLTTVVRAHRTASEQNTELRGVTGVSNRAVIRPVTMTGLDRLIVWFPSVDEATAAEAV